MTLTLLKNHIFDVALFSTSHWILTLLSWDKEANQRLNISTGKMVQRFQKFEKSFLLNSMKLLNYWKMFWNNYRSHLKQLQIHELSEWNDSRMVVNCYKEKGDTVKRRNSRELELTDQILKIADRVI